MPIEDVDALFEVEPTEFVRARDELAGRLRSEGRREEAEEVRRLRRPTIVVWALNQVARHHAKEVAALLEAGEAVRKAQRSRAGAKLREAGNDLQRQVVRVASKAAELGPRVSELEAALRAAALGGDGAEELRVGRLVAVPEAPTGMEMWTAGADDEPGPAPARDTGARRLEEAQARRAKAEDDAERARERVQRVEARIAELQDRLEDERAALAEARERARDAQRLAAKAARDVARLEGGT